ncbi:hypothetical protein TorRG33x02_058470, partial [Trema orientale]
VKCGFLVISVVLGFSDSSNSGSVSLRLGLLICFSDSSSRSIIFFVHRQIPFQSRVGSNSYC